MITAKYTLEGSSELFCLLDNLAAKRQTSVTDIIRSSIALFDVSVQAVDNGYKIAILDRNNKLIQEIVGI